MSNKEVVDTLNLAKRRIKLIDSVLKTDTEISEGKPAQLRVPYFLQPVGVLTEPDLCVRFRNEQIMAHYIKSAKLRGQENLAEALKISQQKEKVMITLNHQTDGDHAAFDFLLRRYYPEFTELADKLIFPAGLKMIERWYIRILFTSIRVVLIATPVDKAQIQNILNNKKDLGLTDESIQLAKSYQSKMVALNERAKKHISCLTKDGFITTIFPEATRSRDGFLGTPPKEVGGYLLEETWILPVAINGLQDVMPAGKRMNFFTKAHFDVRVGKLYHTREIWEKLNDLPAKERFQTGANMMVTKIGELNKELVKGLKI